VRILLSTARLFDDMGDNYDPGGRNKSSVGVADLRRNHPSGRFATATKSRRNMFLVF